MTRAHHHYLQVIANFKWKAKKRFRALFRRNPSYLAAGLLEAWELASVKTKRSDWPLVCSVIDRNDMMYEGHATVYFSSGYSALFCLRQALEKAWDPSSCSVVILP